MHDPDTAGHNATSLVKCMLELRVDPRGTYSNPKERADELEALLRKLPDPHGPCHRPPRLSLPGTARQLEPDQVQELIEGYQAGATVYNLAKQFHIDRRTVGKHLRAQGVDTKPPGLHPDDVPTAAELYRSGWSLVRIANKFETNASTVWKRLREAGVAMRKPHERVARR